MKLPDHRLSRGYTVSELMVSVLVVIVLMTASGSFFAKLLSIQERDREEGYVREALAELCAVYADFMSVGSAFSLSNQNFVVKYRQETGGVSLETGRVMRAAYLKASNVTNNLLERKMLDLRVLDGFLEQRYSRGIMGAAALIPFKGDIDIVSSITPLGTTTPVLKDETDTNLVGFVAADSALGYLRMTAEYKTEDARGSIVTNVISAGRVVRLWNRE